MNKTATQTGATTEAGNEPTAPAGAHYTPRQNRMSEVIRKHTSGEGQTEEAVTHEPWRAEQAGAKPAEAATDENTGDELPGTEAGDDGLEVPKGEGGNPDDLGGAPAGEDDDVPDPTQPQRLNYDGLDDLPLYRMPDGAVKVKMRVHGQDVYEPIDRLKTSAQKATAGDIALQQAARTRQDLQSWEETLKQREAQLATQRQPSPVDAVDEEALAEEARALVEELTLGDTDDAAIKLAQFVQKNVALAARSGSTVDPAAIVEQAKASIRADAEADARFRQEQDRQTDINAGFRRVAEKYPDLISDDRAFGLLDSEAERLELEHGGDPEWTPSRIMEEAADSIAKYLGRTPQGGQQQVIVNDPAPTTNARQQRKDGLRPIPRAGSAVSQSDAPEPVDRSPKSVVERMREQRNRTAGRSTG